jgi:primosomal protein N'
LLRDDERWEVLGPVPYPIARVNEEWRYRLALKTRDMGAIRAVLRERIVPLGHAQRGLRIAINIDP